MALKSKIVKNKAGSTLIWALILMMVLGILIVGGLMIAQSYTTQSLDKHSDSQAYYTALSSTKAVAEWLNGTSEKEPQGKLEQLNYIEKVRESEKPVTFDSTVDGSLGTCSTTVSVDPNNSDITISSTAKYVDSEATVNCVLSNGESSTSGTNPSKIKLLTTPDETKVAIDPNEAKATSDVDKKNLINREMDLNFNSSDAYIIKNNLSPYALPKYANQYYKMNMTGGNSLNSIYVGLQNGNFEATDSFGNKQDRGMIVYAGDTEIKAKNKSLIIYTDQEDNPPRQDIVIAPNFTTTIDGKGNDVGFKTQNNTELRNTHIQINDDGGEDNAVVNIMNGINLTGNSSIYTRRDMYIASTSGRNPMALDKGTLTGTTNSNTFSTLSSYTDDGESYLRGTSVTLEGKLIVAGGTTTLDPSGTYWHQNPDGSKTRENRSVIIDGDIIVGGTPGETAELHMNTSVVFKGGNIFVKDGGTLYLHTWNCTNYNPVFVEPGGTVVSGFTSKAAPIYVLPGTNEEGVGGKVLVAGGSFSSTVHLEDMEGNEVAGKIYLGGNGSEIAKYAPDSGAFGGGQYGVHAMPGSIIDDAFSDARLLCKHGNKNQTNFKTDPKCEHGIKVPIYGNTIEAWTIKGYYEE